VDAGGGGAARRRRRGWPNAGHAVTPKALGAATPASDSLPFVRLAIPSGDRTLIGWWVRASTDSGSTAPAVLFLHGNRSAISDYVPLQRFFHRQGISSFVFDYTGFGASGGDPSFTAAVEDAGNVARVFADSAGAPPSCFRRSTACSRT
jgi:acetyl esterase/lipase